MDAESGVGTGTRAGVLACCSPVVVGEQAVGAVGSELAAEGVEAPPPPQSLPWRAFPLVSWLKSAGVPSCPPSEQEGRKGLGAGVTESQFETSLCHQQMGCEVLGKFFNFPKP